MFEIDKISFRKLEEKDLHMMHKWLNTDFVIEWYDKGGSSFADIEKKYLYRIRGESPTFPYVIVYDNNDIGYIQTYLIEDYPEYSRYVKIDECAAGMDLFIGEKEFIHKGLGKYIMNKFLKEYVFQLSNVISCIIGPEPKNKVAICSYEKTGFRYIKTIQLPDEDEPEYLMRIEKNELIRLLEN
jgi:RimJ/RimL family protein N-acetyltransferase